MPIHKDKSHFLKRLRVDLPRLECVGVSHHCPSGCVQLPKVGVHQDINVDKINVNKMLVWLVPALRLSISIVSTLSCLPLASASQHSAWHSGKSLEDRRVRPPQLRPPFLSLQTPGAGLAGDILEDAELVADLANVDGKYRLTRVDADFEGTGRSIPDLVCESSIMDAKLVVDGVIKDAVVRVDPASDRLCSVNEWRDKGRPVKGHLHDLYISRVGTRPDSRSNQIQCKKGPSWRG